MNDAFFSTLKSNFRAFAEKGFAGLNNGNELEDEPYLRLLAYEFEKVLTGETKKLSVSMPPRHGKTFFGSVCLPAFLIGHDPSLQILIVSYGETVSREIVSKIRRIMLSDWYKKTFPKARLWKRQVTDLETTKGGRVFGVSALQGHF